MAFIIIPLITCLFFLSSPASGAVFNVASGDVPGLIAAINAANANGEENTINLESGTYTLTTVNDIYHPHASLIYEPIGLPKITSKLTLRGAAAFFTRITRQPGVAPFRIIHVGANPNPLGPAQPEGSLTLDQLTISGGEQTQHYWGGGIRNDDTLIITNSTITENTAQRGGGVYNAFTGTMTIVKSTVSSNQGGGIANVGTLTIENSTISDNYADSDGGGLYNTGPLTMRSSTVKGNRSDGIGGGIVNDTDGVRPGAIVTNSTIAGNVAAIAGGGIVEVPGPSFSTVLAFTIVAGNTASAPGGGDDCSGTIISHGANIIGNLGGVGICGLLRPGAPLGFPDDHALHGSTIDPLLGGFIDSGSPGSGHFPLQSDSLGIDSCANARTCPATTKDQLDTPRRGQPDSGAIEFYPLVNDLVSLVNVNTKFDPTPVLGGPAGTFHMTAQFTNQSGQPIGHRFAEVVDLSGGNLVLNADRGPGGVGARITPADSGVVLAPGATQTLEFLIGLQNRQRFTFLVNMLGDAQVTDVAAVEKKNKRQRVKRAAVAFKKKIALPKNNARNGKRS